MNLYHIGGSTYQLVKDHKNGWNFEVFRERYSEVLDRYDYIVGDWGYNQLRLKGFFKDNNAKGNKDSSISLLHDYLNEYCNFGCAYFIVEKLSSKKGPGGRDEDVMVSQLELSAGAEAEKPADPDLKPRQHLHYHRSKENEPKPRNGQDRQGGGGLGQAEPKAREAKPKQAGQLPKDQEFRSKGQERRPKGQDQRPKGQDQRPKDMQARGKEQENKGRFPAQQEQRAKGQQIPSGTKGKYHHDRNKENRERSRVKEKAEPLAEA